MVDIVQSNKVTFSSKHSIFERLSNLLASEESSCLFDTFEEVDDFNRKLDAEFILKGKNEISEL